MSEINELYKLAVSMLPVEPITKIKMILSDSSLTPKDRAELERIYEELKKEEETE